jgi:hypothetical protein
MMMHVDGEFVLGEKVKSDEHLGIARHTVNFLKGVKALVLVDRPSNDTPIHLRRCSRSARETDFLAANWLKANRINDGLRDVCILRPRVDDRIGDDILAFVLTKREFLDDLRPSRVSYHCA